MNGDVIYVSLCRMASRFEWLNRFQDPPEELRRNLRVADLEVTGEEVVALSTLCAMSGGVFAIVVFLVSLMLGLSLAFLMIVGFLPVLLYLVAGWYPSWRARSRIVKGLGEATRLVSYLVGELKINPNIERAARFAAGQTRGPLGNDFCNELWRGWLRAYDSIEESISGFSERWGEWCEELKRSFHLIKSSVSERDEANRKQMLNQALEVTLEGTRERMESFAADLQLPTMIIYAMGVLLPLVLLAVLPVLSSVNVQIGGLELALSYCLVLPLTVYVVERQVLMKRPVAFPPPKISAKDDEKRALLLGILLLVPPPVVMFYLGLSQTIFVLTLLWSITLGVSIYFYLSSAKAYRFREENRRIEAEFCDALVQLGNQMKAGRPAEDAFRHVAESSRCCGMAEIFEKVFMNLKLGGRSLQSAFFDSKEGALKNVYSHPVRSTFRMLLDVMERNSRVAGEAILHVAGHLKSLMSVERGIRRTLGEIVSSMRSVAIFFAPLVAAVTARLQQILSTKTAGLPTFGSGSQISFSIFLGILGFYVLVITLLLSDYAAEIEWGDDRPLKRMTASQTLPLAMGVFTLGLVIGGQAMSILIG